MADPNDVRGTKAARSVFGRKGVDVSMADVRVLHGVLHVRGVVRPIKGNGITDIKKQVEDTVKVLKNKAEIKEVVLDLAYREA
jgi:hypothetical protein